MLRFEKISLRLLLPLIVIFLFTGSSLGATKILFVGNSYTYYNSMPQMFKAMAENLYPDQIFEVKFIGGGGATLEKHWEVGQALQEIQTGEWDFVILQEQSSLGSKNLADSKSWDQFYQYARKFDGEIRQSGATTVFFMTWARRDSRQQQVYLTTAYQTIAKELGSLIAPVGMVWDNTRDENGVELYIKDGSHPSVQGSYLTALTLLATVFKTQPQNTPGKLAGFEILRGGSLAAEKSILSDVLDAVVIIMEKEIQGQMN